MARLLYNLLLPLGFLVFLPGLLVKLARRTGPKATFPERFGVFSAGKASALAKVSGGVWVHSVSVGETIMALDFLRAWSARRPELPFALSTTTTTGQEIAQAKAPPGVPVFYSPIDFPWAVARAAGLLRPRLLVIFETELWPNMIHIPRSAGAKVAVVNARLSDASYRGYRRAGFFFRPILSELAAVCAKSEADASRFRSLCPSLAVTATGSMKFDQAPPPPGAAIPLDDVFGGGHGLVLLAASTHPGEEELVARVYRELETDFQGLRLVLIPRHAERGSEVAAVLARQGLSFHRRSLGGAPPSPVQCLLADTTGEMAAFMRSADLVVMGKCFAGNDGGHNVIEPAAMGKPVVTGVATSNFRDVVAAMRADDAIAIADSDGSLAPLLRSLLADPGRRADMGGRAAACVARNRGATAATITILEELLCLPKPS